MSLKNLFVTKLPETATSLLLVQRIDAILIVVPAGRNLHW